MQTQRLDAVYEHGVLRPIGEPHLHEGEKVQLIIESNSPDLPPDLEALAHLLDGLTEEEIAEFERHLVRPASMFDPPDDQPD